MGSALGMESSLAAGVLVGLDARFTQASKTGVQKNVPSMGEEALA